MRVVKLETEWKANFLIVKPEQPDASGAIKFVLPRPSALDGALLKREALLYLSDTPHRGLIGTSGKTKYPQQVHLACRETTPLAG